MTLFTSFVLVFAVSSSTVTSVHALPIANDHENLRKRSSDPTHTVATAFGIAIGVIIFAMIMFYLGLRRGRTGSLLRRRTHKPTGQPPRNPPSTTMSQSGPISSKSPKLSRSTTATSISTITISTPKPVHASSFSLVSPIDEHFSERYERRQPEKPQPQALITAAPMYQTTPPAHPIFEPSDTLTTSLTQPPSTATPASKCELIRNNYLSQRIAPPPVPKLTRFPSYRASPFSPIAAATAPPTPGLTRKLSFEDWRREYAPRRRASTSPPKILTKTTLHRRRQSSLEKVSPSVLDKEVNVAIFEVDEDIITGFEQDTQMHIPTVFEQDDEHHPSRPTSLSSQATLVTPVSPRIASFASSKKNTDWPLPPRTPTSPNFPLPLLLRLTPRTEEGNAEWEDYASATDVEDGVSVASGFSDESSDDDDENRDEFEYDVTFDFDIKAIEAHASLGSAFEITLDDKDENPTWLVFPTPPSSPKNKAEEHEKETTVPHHREETSAHASSPLPPHHRELESNHTPPRPRSHTFAAGEEIDWTGIEWLRGVYAQRKSGRSLSLGGVSAGSAGR